MSSSPWMSTSTGSFSERLDKVAEAVEAADAVLVGAGAGLSAAGGPEFSYSGERFERLFGDFERRYGFHDIYAGGFYPYDSLEEMWAFWSRSIWYDRYACPVGQPYRDLLEVLDRRDFFVLTTNVDHQFQRAGFDKERLFYTQGDYGLWQCSKPCHNKTYDNYEAVREMVNRQHDLKIPTGLVPKCPVCGEPMSMNLRSDDSFVEDAGWHAAAKRYADFVARVQKSRLVLLELGVGGNTPVIIKYPFWRMCAGNAQSTYVQMDYTDALIPRELAERSIVFDEDAAACLSGLTERLR